MKIIANEQLANLSETVKKGDILTVSDNTLIDQNGEVVLFEAYREYEGSYEVSRCHHYGHCYCGGEEVDICGTEVLLVSLALYEDSKEISHVEVEEISEIGLECGSETLAEFEVDYTEVTDYEDIDLVELKNALKFCTVINDTKVA